MTRADGTVLIDEPVREARREPRFPCDRAIQIVPCEGFGAGTFHTVRMIDRSSRGIGLLAVRPVRPGSQFVARLDSDLPRHIYTVRHCRATGQGHYRLGAELACVA